jgi:HSP20 family protein
VAVATHKQDRAGTAPDWALALFTPWKLFDDIFQDPYGGEVIKVDELHKDGMLVIRAELPGIDPGRDLDVTVDGNELYIAALRREEEDETGHHHSYHRRELCYGNFARAIALPDGIDEDTVTATYKNGVLEVVVPLPHGTQAEEAPRKVPVQYA